MTEERFAPGFYVRVGPPAPGGGSRADGAKSLDETTRIRSLKFEDDEQKPDKLTLVVDNYDLFHLDSDTWAKGNVIQFAFGYSGGAMSPPRTAIVQTVKGFQSLTVEAQSGDTLMNRTSRPDRVFENMTRSEVVRAIAKEYGYQDDELSIEDTFIVQEQVTQGPRTDYQLIRELAWKEGFEFYIDFEAVHFHKRPLTKPPTKTFRWFTEQKQGELLSINIEDSIAPEQRKVGAVNMRGRDPISGKFFEVRVDNASAAGRPILMPTMSVHEAKLEGNAERPLSVNGAEFTTSTTETTEEGAKRQAAAHFAKLQMRAVKMSLSAIGDPGVSAKSVVRVEGIGQRYSGLYYVRSATHEVGSNGYTMALKLSTDGKNVATGPAAKGTPAG